jgi:hypothetical protein
LGACISGCAATVRGNGAGFRGGAEVLRGLRRRWRWGLAHARRCGVLGTAPVLPVLVLTLVDAGAQAPAVTHSSRRLWRLPKHALPGVRSADSRRRHRSAVEQHPHLKVARDLVAVSPYLRIWVEVAKATPHGDCKPHHRAVRSVPTVGLPEPSDGPVRGSPVGERGVTRGQSGVPGGIADGPHRGHKMGKPLLSRGLHGGAGDRDRTGMASLEG